jgi:Na+-transporting NADH:ubiquinone oxidoreductase subunit F
MNFRRSNQLDAGPDRGYPSPMPPTQIASNDYSLTGVNAKRAIELGLAEADWYQSPVPRATMRRLLERRDGPAIRDTLLLLLILVSTGYATVVLWGTWWVVIPYLAYAVFYGTSSDSRWHECGHGTAFRTDWMNAAVYEIASFMVMRESVVWRWSHTRHHSDTIIVGRDPEIQLPRPPDMLGLGLGLFAAGVYRGYFSSLVRHACGRMTPAERTYIPESEFPKIHRNARIVLLIYLTVIASAVALRSWIPVFLFILPQFFGTWLMIVHNTTQHAGLAENVLDHRLNCRTVYMNPISRFIYWNMNYHVEHHMFPLVPYHALPKLHEAIKADCPPPYRSILEAWREILPALFRQVRDPGYHVNRRLPEPGGLPERPCHSSDAEPDADGWIEVCAAADLAASDVVRFDHSRKTYAIYRDDEGTLHATDGVCTHGNTHLSEGLVIGKLIECPKHNGRFNLADGSPARMPVCRGLATYSVVERDGRLWLDTTRPCGAGARPQKNHHLRVVSSRNVATFIRELVLEPVSPADEVTFTPGDYLQFDIPVYQEIRFADFDIPEPFATVWRVQHVFDLVAANPTAGRRNNYSIAGPADAVSGLRLNVRIATPPPGQDCPPGAGSSYMFSLKPGDIVTAIGPGGDFHIRPTQKEMVYIGGGAGMAPMRAHLSHLLETERSARRISYWYGARSLQELFYQDYFDGLARRHANFTFHPALSSPLPEDGWTGHTGFIHEVVLDRLLKNHPQPGAVEFYLCGPPQMIKACNHMLAALGVAPSQISHDTF